MMRPVDRQFYSIDSSAVNKSHFHTPSDEQKEKLVEYVAANVIGHDKIFSGPFGLRKALYLDYIASGRALSFLEDFIRDEVLPEYGNTHTTTSVTSLQTTLFRHEARDIIRNAVNASEHDSVIFAGSGSTGAIHKLIHALHLTQPPVVFVGPFEHHSNILPWKETGAVVVRIKQTQDGHVNITHLEQELLAWSGSERQLIGSFSAASNVTGILTDVDAITICLHKHGALAFWDYATAAPYVKLDMNPVLPGKDAAFVYKDAMFISPHKFVGGVSTPGVLVAKKKLFQNVVPEKGGGGTVFFVRRDAHRYLREPELREEGGTPAIVGAIRAGLVFQLKAAITPDVIMAREQQLFRRAREAWRSVANLVILGNLDADRLPVFSFLIHHPHSGLFLHYNYVSALLNDLFGIQARGGCACAGPYAMDLLGLTEERAEEIEELLAEDGRLDRVHLRRYTEYSHREIIRPGFTRLNLPFFMQDDELDFVLQAVTMVAEQGWKLLPQYMFNPETGEWRQRDQQVFRERKWLGQISYAGGHMEYALPKPVAKGPLPESFQSCLEKARQVFAKAGKSRMKLPDHSQMFDEEARRYRWFLLPSEAGEILGGNLPGSPRPPCDLPFCPPDFRERLVGKDTSLDISPPVGINSASKNVSGTVAAESCSGCSRKHDAGDQHLNLSVGVPKRVPEKNTAQTERVGAGDAPHVRCNGCVEENVRECTGPDRCGGQTEESEVKDQTNSSHVSEDSRTVCVRGDVEGGRSAHCMKTICSAVHTNCSTDHAGSSHGGGEKTHAGQSAVDCVTDAKPHTDRGCAAVESCCTEHHVDATPSSEESNKDTVCPELEDFPQVVQYFMERGYESGTPPCSHTETPVKTHTSKGGVGSDELVTVSHTLSAAAGSSEAQHAAESLSIGKDLSQLTQVPGESTQVQTSSMENGTSDESTHPSTASSSGQEGPLIVPESADSAAKTVKKKKTTKMPKQKEQSGENAEMQMGVKKREKKGSLWFPPPREIFKPAVKAMEEFSMVANGDRVLVCLSGGKDSLSLLHTMHQYQFYCRNKGISFELGAVTVDPQTPSYDPSPLKDYLTTLGVPYFYESQCIMETAVNLPYECASICSFCSRMKRGRIYAAARREGFNVLALGQHLDDLAESFIMSLFHNGSLRTMKANYTVQEGDLRVIRPFVYVRERDLRSFAEKNKLPVIAENCPACFEAPKERHRTKQLLASQEILFPRIYSSILSAIKPVMALSRTGTNASDILPTSDTGDDFDI